MSFYNYSVYKSNGIVEEFLQRYAKDPSGAKTYLEDILKTTPDIIKHLVISKIKDTHSEIEL